MVAFHHHKTHEHKIGTWLSFVACLLLGTVIWLGFRQLETQQKTNQLFLALQAANPVAVRTALDQGADPNSVTAGGVVSSGFSSAVRQWSAYLMHRDLTTTALILAVHSKNIQCIRLLLDKGANPDGQDSYGSTPLIAVSRILHYGNAQSGHTLVQYQLQMTQLLLAAGADINKTDPVGNTALVYAIAGHNMSLERLLLAHGAHQSVPRANPI